MTQTKTYPIVMLPKKELTDLFIANGKLYYGKIGNTMISNYTCQELYITSDEEIREGDWFINELNQVWQLHCKIVIIG